jgi:DNA polymerase alpha subunit B
MQPSIKFNSSTPQRQVRSGMAASTPDSVQGSPDMQGTPQSQAEAAGSFMNRTNAGQQVLEYSGEPSLLGKRGHVDISQTKPCGLRCKVVDSEEDFENVKGRYRYMYTNLDERARALEKQLVKIQASMCALAQINPDDLCPVGIPSQDLVWCCGRICCSAAIGKLNKASVVLEGSRRDSGGRRVLLDLTEVAYSVFPGQIVLVEGTNSTGKKLTAKRIVTGAQCPLPTSVPAKLLEYHHSKFFQGSKPLSVVVCAGPYTTTDNLNYDPLRMVLTKVATERPDVLILLGPFVDISQPLLQTGDIKLLNDPESGTGLVHSANYGTVFVERVVRDGLSQLFGLDEDNTEPLNTNIIMIPSLIDGHHDFVFPQPPFAAQKNTVKSTFTEEDEGALDIPFSTEKDARKRVHLLPNPCMFRVNEILFGVTTNDVTFGLSTEEISQEPAEAHRITRLASHMLLQQSFAPQFPPPPSSQDKILTGEVSC